MSAESIQLIKCLVQNKDERSSFRLIEKSNFDLWQFLMTTKHQIRILKSSLCLWVDESDFESKRAIYERVGEISVANKLTLMMYDDHGNFNNVVRYVQQPDTHEVKNILLNHLPPSIKNHQQFSIDVELGYLVTKGPLVAFNLTNTAALETI